MARVPINPLGFSVSIGEIEDATVVTAAETIAANDNDTTIPTSAAVKAYADTKGDVTGPALSVDDELALFSGITGKIIKRTSTSGIAKLVSGVLSVVTAPTGAIVGDTDTQTLSAKTLTAPKIADTGFVADENGNEQIKFSTTASAVNEVTVKNAATGGAPDIQATGGDTNIDLKLTPKGTGKVAPQKSVNFGAFTAYFTETDNGNSSTADTIDWTLSNKQKSTLTGNCTFTFTAPPGPCNLLLKLVQDATGSRTVTWPAAVKWSGGTAPTLTTTASRADIITFYYDGSSYYGTSVLNFVP